MKFSMQNMKIYLVLILFTFGVSTTIAFVGSDCSDEDPCEDRLTCNKDGKCECEEGYEVADDKMQCRMIPNTHAFCEIDIDCEAIKTGIDSAATCNELIKNISMCTCPNNWDLDKDRYECYSLFSHCNSTDPCQDRQTCLSPFGCQCDKGYEPSDNLHYCRKILDDKFSCEENIDCEVIYTGGTGEAKCGDKTCTCPDDKWDLRKNGDRFECYAVGVSCTDDDSCADRLTCNKNGKCECEHGYEIADDKVQCRKSLDDNFSCELDIDCEDINTGGTGSAKCPYKTCECPQKNWKLRGTEVDGFECFAVGVDCKDDSSCADRLTCKTGKCECEELYEVANDKLQCRKPLDATFSCEKDVDCEVINTGDTGPATCNNEKKCKCPEDEWYLRIKLGEFQCSAVGAPCTGSSSCDYRLTCEDNMCECREGYEITDDTLQCRMELSDVLSCQTNIDCEAIILNGDSCVQCLDNICTCTSPEDWQIRKTDAQKYETYAPLGAKCSDEEDCNTSIDNSTCVDTFCVCDKGFKPDDIQSTCIDSGCPTIISTFALLFVSYMISKAA